MYDRAIISCIQFLNTEAINKHGPKKKTQEMTNRGSKLWDFFFFLINVYNKATDPTTAEMKTKTQTERRMTIRAKRTKWYRDKNQERTLNGK